MQSLIRPFRTIRFIAVPREMLLRTEALRGSGERSALIPDLYQR
jgi:hypothetical protein